MKCIPKISIPITLVYTYFSKAFDGVDHCIPFNKVLKLEQRGLSDNLTVLIISYKYLTERKLCYIYGFKSNNFIANSGVP